MAIKSRKNLYRGVNPHLHSQFQRLRDPHSMWGAFLTQHSTDLVEGLNRILPDDYRAVSGPSLQVLTEEHHLTEIEFVGILVYHQTEPFEHPLLGHCVVRLEVLSPPNMSGGAFEAFYLQRRRDVLMKGITVIELDYLHGGEPQAIGLPDYPFDANSYPYYAVVVDANKRPREAGNCYVAGVDVRLPTIAIPLDDGLTLDFALDEVYQYTFEAGRWGDQVDYAEPPERLDTYSEHDRNTILAKMAAIEAKLGKQGGDGKKD
ncbi:MAG: hypothetical protein BroJett018_39280 [Chloroflexota bacterium]|nr:MAG: hypothetical protein BroJett018_39280 [Chloroflexota bacterium]